MKRLRPMFKKLEGILLTEIPNTEIQQIKYFTDYVVCYYEAMLIEKKWPTSVREVLDCVDFIVLHERDPQCYDFWPRIAELYKRAMEYLKDNTSIWEDPIYGQGYYSEERLRPRYEFKCRILRGNAERLGYVVM